MSQSPASSAIPPPAGSDALMPSDEGAPGDPRSSRLAQLFRKHAPDTANRMLQDAIRQYRGRQTP